MNEVSSLIFGILLIGVFIGAIGSLGSIDEDNNCFLVFGGIFLLFFVLLIGFGAIVITCGAKDWTTESEPYSIEYIEALSDSSMMNGRMYVRSGYIEEQPYYQYMVKQSDGGFVYNRVKARTAKIYYTDDDNYRVEWYRRTKNFLFASQEEVLQKIYVPKGSIEDSFSIDLN